MIRVFTSILLSIFILSCERGHDSHTTSSQDILVDSISSLIKKSSTIKSNTLYLEQAYGLTSKISNQITQLKCLKKISYKFYKKKDSFYFKKTNNQALKLAIKLNDSSSIAELYWDLGNYFFNTNYKDSSFYYYTKAEKLYEKLNNGFYAGRMLVNKAIVQTSIRDYTGSEITSYQAISLLNPLKKYNQLYRCHNNLGIIYNELEDYDKSLFHHREALSILENLDKKDMFLHNTLNNIGVVTLHQKKYKEASSIFKKSLEVDSLLFNNPKLYAMLLDNLAYSNFLAREDSKNEIESNLKKALFIRDSINDTFGVIVNKIHLAEFYINQKDTIKAIENLKEAKNLAKLSNNFRDLLSSLNLLSNIDRNNKSAYLKDYIQISDSLQKAERTERNKFTRIAYETAQFKFKNQQLQYQKSLLIILFILLALSTFLLFVIKSNRSKNRILAYEQKQQKANEEIYALMLSQQTKIEEGRQEEKNRISGELHDGILGNLFGLRLSLGGLNSKSDQRSINLRSSYIDEIKNIEEEIRNISHELSKEPRLNDIGFIQLINQLLHNKASLGNFEGNLEHFDDIQWYDIDNNIKMNIYRLIQESLQNIIKHAKASKVKVTFTRKGNTLFIKVLDNGIGFNTKKVKEGIGLKNMEGRAFNIKGTMKVSSKINKGTSIEFKIPIQTNN